MRGRAGARCFSFLGGGKVLDYILYSIKAVEKIGESVTFVVIY